MSNKCLIPLLLSYFIVSALFVGPLIDKYGFRPVAVVGVSLTSTGIFAAVFANKLYFLYVTLGVISGDYRPPRDADPMLV